MMTEQRLQEIESGIHDEGEGVLARHVVELVAEVRRLRKYEAFHEDLKELSGFSGVDMLDALSLSEDINYAHSYR